jgi:hypothetical protein
MRSCWQSDPGAGMDVLGLQGMIDNLPQTVDTTFSSNLNSPAIDFGVPKTGNYFNGGSTDMLPPPPQHARRPLCIPLCRSVCIRGFLPQLSTPHSSPHPPLAFP